MSGGGCWLLAFPIHQPQIRLSRRNWSPGAFRPSRLQVHSLRRISVIWAITAPERGWAARSAVQPLLPTGNDMQTRTTTKLVTFRKAFLLSSLDGPMPAGTYTIHTQEEMMDTVSFVGWRQIGCAIVLHREGADEHVAVDPQELREALVHDGDQGTDPPGAPSVAVGRRARGLARRAGR